MAFRLYIVPTLPADRASFIPLRPKYFNYGVAGDNVLAPSVINPSYIYYGIEPWCVVGADLPVSEHNAVMAQPDTFAPPANLDGVLSAANATTVRARLDAVDIPSAWVVAGLTWRSVMRDILGLFLFVQAYAGAHDRLRGTYPNRLFGGGVTLDTTWGEIPVAARAAMLGAAAALNLTSTGVTDATTLRAIFRSMMTQFTNQTYNFNGVLV